MTQPVPTIGRIVHYTLNEGDARNIGAKRGVASPNIGSIQGNGVRAGDVYPMLITRAWGDQPDSLVNGQVFLDGGDCLWVTSVKVGEGPRTFAWPTRA
jgi:hypothetical protein